MCVIHSPLSSCSVYSCRRRLSVSLHREQCVALGQVVDTSRAERLCKQRSRITFQIVGPIQQCYTAVHALCTTIYLAMVQGKSTFHNVQWS